MQRSHKTSALTNDQSHVSSPRMQQVKDPQSQISNLKPVQRYMRVRRYSNNKDGVRELIAEEELLFNPDEQNPNQKVDELIHKLQSDKQTIVP